MRRVLCAGAALLATVLGVRVPEARATNLVQFGFGQMKNLYIDLIFWGWGKSNGDMWQDPDAQFVRNAVEDVSSWLNTGWSLDNYGNLVPPSPGMEAAVHSYGLSGVLPGLWISDPTDINPKFVTGTAQPGDSDLYAEVDAAWAHIGLWGEGVDFNDNGIDPLGLSAGSNRLTLVITKGTNAYYIGGQNDCGYHSSHSGHPYGAVMLDAGHNPSCLSHEILEAMSNPFPDTGQADQSGWFAVTQRFPVLGYDEYSDEIADECEHAVPGALPFAKIPVDPTYDVPNFFASANQSCLLNIPEQHAPMAAALEMGGNGEQPLDLVYVATNGHVQEVGWDGVGWAPSNPYDWGQPSPTVKAVGKPSLVYSIYQGGERIFVKGSDSAVWMLYNGAWTSLGGVIYGDPSVFMASQIYNYQNVLYITALGTDDKIYLQDLLNGTPSGWYGPISDWGPTQGTLFVGSVVGGSRAANTADFFAIGEDGTVKQIAWNSSAGWASPTTVLSTCCVTAESSFTQTPSVAVGANGTTVLFAGLLNGIVSSAFTVTDTPNGWWSGGAMTLSGGNYDFTGNSLQGSVASVSSASQRFDAFAVSRQGELWWWYNTAPVNGGWPDGMGNNQPLVAGNSANPATGDPVVVSRYSGEVEVFYRTGSGQLAHLTHVNGAWLPVEISLPAGSIR